MLRNKEPFPAGGSILFLLVLINGIIIRTAYTGNGKWSLLLFITLPLLLFAVKKNIQEKDSWLP